MDEWHRKLARELVSETPAGAAPEGEVALEIALGESRSAIVYALELARAHRLPATGTGAGDDVWFQLGDDRLRVTLNRRDGGLTMGVTGQPEARFGWDPAKRALVGSQGAQPDIGSLARVAINAIVSSWRGPVGGSRRPRASLAPEPDRDDEPTKG